MSLVFLGLTVVLLVAISGFFSGSETALTAVSRARMHQLEREGSRAAREVNKLVADKERMIGAILLGNTFLNILISSLATEALAPRLGERAVVITTILVTIIVLVFAEVLPKTLAIARTDRFALNVAWLLRPTVGLLAPVVGLVQAIVWALLRLVGIGRTESDPVVEPHEEIRGTVEVHHREGAVEREHRDMLSGVLDLRELKVADVMIHRKNVLAIDANQEPQELFEDLLEARHARVPVWRDSPENIVGILHTRDVLREFVRRHGSLEGFDILSLMTPAWFVPDTTTLEEQLAAFREQRSHFALVVDEYGALQGLITRNDIFDEIFGDIPDEHERTVRRGVRPQADGSYIVDGTTPIRDLNRELDWNLPDEEASTIAGLVIHEARTIPEPRQRFAFYGFKFEILRRQRNQITALKITPPPAPGALSAG
ncbi:MAG: HlyC/CorC family transporter [Alphaproteobacteria bacterium]|nr:HlyC/CorC family transporter [Alphaproteobacteria bacterium]